MNIFLKLLLTAVAVFVLAKFLPGIAVDNYASAIIVAFTISVLNMLVRPILVLFTLPVTILTLGLFLLVINAIIILFADGLVSGFHVSGIFTALIFSVLLSFFRSILFKLLKEDE